MTTRKFMLIAEDLTIPASEFVTQTIVVYGGKGMGKTNLGAVIAEELAACGQRFAFLDPVGVSWGLRHGAGGRGAGLQILILGGLHGDLPIEPTGGAVVADLVADEDADVLIDISRRGDGRMWSNGEKIRFVTDYATRLYERQGERRRPLMQIFDEAGRFVPQNPPKGAIDIAKCIGAIEQLVELGRNVGVGVTLITQRSARMNKSVSELAECMIAFRTVGPRSVDAILDWFGEHVEKDKWRALVEQLRSLPRGHALIVSPGWLEFEGVARIRKRETFDSSSTPTGEERKLAQRAARPDLEKYRARILETVEKAEAADPSKLRAKLAKVEKDLALEREKSARLEATRKPASMKAAAPALTDHDRKLLADYAARLAASEEILTAHTSELIERIRSAILDDLDTFAASLAPTVERRRAVFLEQLERAGFKRILEKLRASASAAIAPTPVPKATAAAPRVEYDRRDLNIALKRRPAREDASENTDALNKPTRAILTVLAQYRRRLPRNRILDLAGYRASGDTSKAFAAVVRNRWASDAGGNLEITAEGLAALGDYEPFPTGAELRQYLMDSPKMSAAERKLARALFEAYPAVLSRAAWLERAGLKPSGDTQKAIAKFRRMEWAVDGGMAADGAFGGFRAADHFYSDAEETALV